VAIGIRKNYKYRGQTLLFLCHASVVATSLSAGKIIESEEEMLVIVKDLQQKVIQSLHSLASEEGLSEQEVGWESVYANGWMDVNVHGRWCIRALVCSACIRVDRHAGSSFTAVKINTY